MGLEKQLNIQDCLIHSWKLQNGGLLSLNSELGPVVCLFGYVEEGIIEIFLNLIHSFLLLHPDL